MARDETGLNSPVKEECEMMTLPERDAYQSWDDYISQLWRSGNMLAVAVVERVGRY